ncbi:MAG: DUF4381 domain-containing protein [Haliea sp.]|uniref:DUF4381 domain-containing protein n=1 Tax=Haliea sp. TaxID=1932666 RepID=UPI0032EAE9F2
MNPQDPLAALQPLRPPEPLPWWPPAPGWWLIAGLLLVALAWAAWRGWRSYRRNEYRRTARRTLQAILARHAEHGDPARTLGELNMLLKAVALHAFPRAEVASLSGERWRSFLNDSLAQVRTPLRFPEVIARAHAPTPGPVDTIALQRCANTWLRRHRGTQ